MWKLYCGAQIICLIDMPINMKLSHYYNILWLSFKPCPSATTCDIVSGILFLVTLLFHINGTPFVTQFNPHYIPINININIKDHRTLICYLTTFKSCHTATALTLSVKIVIPTLTDSLTLLQSILHIHMNYSTSNDSSSSHVTLPHDLTSSVTAYIHARFQ